ncbi:hypothetical protein KAFR_0C04120 [Kazachstania africana CBS 2517]|uniref:Glucose-6-phosphate 1-dehydrogenase n=1 Tax=Kazachstania africana (strain ATCC 22294 / BCRC 22015 / CBS 2517 / CECT 1963 / NBRC 1671 / NRRL Y-8276) TaxID=1071382 RepID=H2ASQ3_KAZAF|nr:hypothetical protein KAFR_0C04120 [Kazachstania africana CBS 2517]CCF57403.1 hypothetical protein KAFR_0C04120 [Kazachstania africana CBS 2517]
MPSVSTQPISYHEKSSIVVFGASGDLAKRSIFPGLFSLYREGFLKPNTQIIGYARSKLTKEQLISKFQGFLRKPDGAIDDVKEKEFYNMLTYVSGAYDSDEGYEEVRNILETFENNEGVTDPRRLFYFSIPPNVFIPVAQQIKKLLYVPNGGTRVVVEKPFGNDLKTAEILEAELEKLFTEDEMLRMDHFLGKESIQSLIPLRFSNELLSAVWDRKSIKSMYLSFKEPFGTEGRGGYFDPVGMIRDVMQNHLLQVIALITMEKQRSFDSKGIRDAKVNVLKAMTPFDNDNVLVGQYSRSVDGKKPSYLDDETVPKGSKSNTYAFVTFNIDNDRWRGVPIIMGAGKATDEDQIEVRVQFHKDTPFFSQYPQTELVIRTHPDFAVYLDFHGKIPELEKIPPIPDAEAYRVLIKDAIKGDSSKFVGFDELETSWKLFTPLLNHLEGPNGPQPELYPYGSKGPESINKYLEKNSYEVKH